MTSTRDRRSLERSRGGPGCALTQGMGCPGLPLLLPHHHLRVRWLWFEADVPRACSSQVSFPAYRNVNRGHTTLSPRLGPQTQDLPWSQLTSTWVTNYTQENVRVLE